MTPPIIAIVSVCNFFTALIYLACWNIHRNECNRRDVPRQKSIIYTERCMDSVSFTVVLRSESRIMVTHKPVAGKPPVIGLHFITPDGTYVVCAISEQEARDVVDSITGVLSEIQPLIGESK